MLAPHVQTAVILVNPRARGVSARHFDAEGALRYLRRRGVDASLVVAESPEQMSAEAAAAARRGAGSLFVVGGDGALRLAAREVADSATALAAIPGGTANVWAREAGIPRGFRAAFDAHLSGQVASMDLGTAGDGVFLLMASAGWDAAIAASVSLALKKRSGPLAYVVRAVHVLPSLRTVRTEFNVTDATGDPRHYDRSLGVIVIGNSRLYGGVVEIAHRASARDGLLDVYALCPESRGDGALLAWRAVRHTLDADSRAVVDRGSTISILTAGLPLQLDGDPAGETPVVLGVRPAALRVSLPPGPLPPVLR